MRIRDKSYKDYGFQEGEEKEILMYIHSKDFDDHLILLQSAIISNVHIASEIYYSIIKGISFESVDKIKYIPISKNDFYGYRRNALYIFKQFLELHGKWRNKDGCN